MIKRLMKNKIYFIFMICVLFLFPTAISLPSIANTSLVVVALGIDKIEDEYETSIMMLVPKQSGAFNQSLEVISAKGETVRQAMNQLSIHTGKKIGLGHCGMIILNDEALKEDILKSLDYLIRDTQVDNSCVIVNTNKSSKKLLNANKDLQKLYGVDSAGILDFLSNYVFLEEANIEKIIDSKLSGNNVNFMAYMELVDDESDGLDVGKKSESSASDSSSGDSSSDSGGDGGSGGGQDNEEKVVSNLGQITLLLDGKKVAVADNDIMKGLFWLGQKQSKLEFFLSNYSDENLKNADLSFVVKDKSISKEYKFVGDRPVINLNINTSMKLNEIVSPYEKDLFFVSYADYVGDTMKNAITAQIKTSVLNSIQFLIDNKTDVIEAYRGFEKYHYKKWKTFLNSLTDKKDFLKEIDFNINVNATSKL